MEMVFGIYRFGQMVPQIFQLVSKIVVDVSEPGHIDSAPTEEMNTFEKDLEVSTFFTFSETNKLSTQVMLATILQAQEWF